MTVLAWVGAVVGVVALLLAVAALLRAVPTFNVGRSRVGRREVWHQGPGSVMVTKAYVEYAGGIIPLQELPSNDIWDEDGMGLRSDDPYAKGAVILPHRRYSIFLNLNRTLIIKYRAMGFLGWLSRETLRIPEGP